MSDRFLLDANVLSEPMRPRPNAAVLSHLDECGPNLTTSSTVWHELTFGARRLPPSRKRDAIQAWLDGLEASALEILPYDAHAARWHAEERARLQRLGIAPPYADGQIAAVAAVRGLVLVTRNVSDFASFEELRVVNWFGEGDR